MCVCVCVCVRTIIFEISDGIWTRYLTCWFNLTLPRSNYTVQVKGQSSKSYEKTRAQQLLYKVSNYFGINTVKELIHNCFQKFRISYGAADNYLCRLIFAKCWTYSDCTVYIFCFFSWLPFFDGEIRFYIMDSAARMTDHGWKSDLNWKL